MKEYIKRETAIAKCREIAACEWNHRASPVSWADAYEQFAEDIEGLPSAYVAPVRHGRWIKRKTWNFHVCSECSFETRPYMSCMNYCPNCGAKMDLEHAQKGGGDG